MTRPRFLCHPLLFLFAISILFAPPATPHSLYQSEREIIRNSAHVVVGVVTDRKVHWNEQHTLIVTDYYLVVEDRLKGQAPALILLSIPGGTLDGETHSTCVSVSFQEGNRYLLFLGNMEEKTIEPVVGAWQGVFREVSGKGGRRAISAGNSSETLKSEGDEIEFSTFVETLRALVAESTSQPEGKSAPISARPLPAKEYDPAPSRAGSPLSQSLPSPSEIPAPPPFKTVDDIEEPLPSALVLARAPESSKYVYQNAPPASILFNPLPLSWSWSPFDQQQMGYWNVYAANLFRVYTTPTGTWAFRNGVFDLAGFPSNAQMVQQFGQSWGAGVLGVTWTRSIGGMIVEADIALNPAFAWTTDTRTATLASNNVHSFQHTMLHEVGHSWGLKHPWETQDVWWDSVMNYAPKAYRSPILWADDANAVRRAYPGTSLRDGGVAVYTTRDTTTSRNPTYVPIRPPRSLRSGQRFTLGGRVKLENLGTTNLANPVVEIYLTPQRFNWDGAIRLKTLRLNNTVLPFYTLTVDMGTLQVPAGTRAGNYWIGVYLRDSADGFQFNNSAWVPGT